LADIGASLPDLKQELTIRINRLSRYPGLVHKVKAKSEKADAFPCSLESVDIPPATAKTRTASDDLPRVDSKMFTQDVSKKRELVSKRKRSKFSQVEKLSMLKL